MLKSNLTMRTHLHRFVRMGNCYLKKFENLRYSVTAGMVYYNFVRIHSVIKCSPAMEANVTDQVWTVAEVVNHLYRQPVIR
jgi:hypothetical protein